MSGDKDKAKPFLPPDKQYLETKNGNVSMLLFFFIVVLILYSADNHEISFVACSPQAHIVKSMFYPHLGCTKV